MQDERRAAVSAIAERVVSIIGDQPTVDRLEEAKPYLMELANRQDLFPAEDFPLPTGDATDRTYLIWDNEQGAALYAVTGITGMHYRPHDHGGSWAMIAAVAGQEQHRFYEEDPTTPGKLIDKGGLICEPGTAVSLTPAGIHAIASVGETPLLHLHFYGTRFEDQAERTEYDLEAGTTDIFRMEAFGFIEDMR